MKVTLGSNIASLRGQRSLNRVNQSIQTVYERLASGQRINGAVDDAAGLAIAESLHADNRVYTQAIRNINDGLSALSIYDGALEQLSNVVVRQKELAEQAANGIYTTIQRKALETEARALTAEFNRIIESVEFNGRSLMENPGDSFYIQAGYGSDTSIGVSLGSELARTVGTGTFTSFFELPTVPVIETAAIEDLNKDGLGDVITSSDSGGDLVVSLSNGDGTFQGPMTFGDGGDNQRIDFGDINGDGNIDVITADVATEQVNVSYGNGDGTFAAYASYAVGIDPNDMNVADVNNDGLDDIITISDDTATFSVLLGRPSGPLTTQTFSTITNATRMDVADYDNDGNLDVITSQDTGGSDRIVFYKGNGAGSFSYASSIAADVGGSGDVGIGDFNNDTFADVFLGDLGANNPRVYFGNGDGTFSGELTLASGSFNPVHVQIGDVTGDGIDDVIAGSAGSGIGIYVSNGDGTFRTVQTIATTADQRKFDLGDIHGDGVPEIGVALRSNNAAAILTQTTGSTNKQAYFELKTTADARSALDMLDGELRRIASERGQVGATQGRLEVAANNLISTRENYMAARSRIIDADVAQEAAHLLRLSILQEAAAAVLSQANQQPALTLQLL